MLQIIERAGDAELAQVFVARLAGGGLIELAESVQPPVPREQKWVLIVSTLEGCPVGCPICDAGGEYRRRLCAAEIFDQIDYLIRSRYPSGAVPVPKLKVQLARMGEPALNDAVLEVLRSLPARFDAPGLMPCISTVAPRGREAFFEELLAVKRELYAGGRFQMQFSVHSTDPEVRARLIPIRTWGLDEMAAYGARFVAPGDRKIALNFAPARGAPLDAEVLARSFSPELFLVKLTPINPTRAATAAGLTGLIDPADRASCEAVAESFRRCGFETILSIGEADENRIGSNCGMLVRRRDQPRGMTAREIDSRAHIVDRLDW